MTTAVWKYEIPVADNFALRLPEGARFLHVDVQDGHPRLWVLVDTEQAIEDKFFVLAGTGHPIPEAPEQLAHIGTYMLLDGALVFHLFERFVGFLV